PGTGALVHAAPLGLGRHLDHVDVQHIDLEQGLDGLPDLGLVCLGMHLERVLVALGDHAVALLRHDRREQHAAGIAVHFESPPSSTLRAALETSTERAQTRSATSRALTSATSVRLRLRKERARPCSSAVVITTSGPSPRHSATSSAAALVRGSAN